MAPEDRFEKKNGSLILEYENKWLSDANDVPNDLVFSGNTL